MAIYGIKVSFWYSYMRTYYRYFNIDIFTGVIKPRFKVVFINSIPIDLFSLK